MYIINENEREYRFGDSGPKYLMKGPRMNFAIVQFMPGQDFTAHYHNVMEENFFILEGKIDIVVDGKVNTLSAGDLIHIEPSEVHYCINNHRRHFFLPIILQNMTAAIVLAAVAARHGPVITAGDGLPYWLR